MGKWGALVKHLENEIQKLNDHLPKVQVSLESLISNHPPKVETRDGIEWHFDQKELDQIAEKIPQDLWAEISIPIIFLRRTDMGAGAFTISGNKATQFLVAKLLGLTDLPPHAYRKLKTPLILYRPQISQIRKILKTTSTISFGVSIQNQK
ncbi:MAG: DUF61 family protein [Candidatus Ranarchaeia archaeon]|jgi:uncharacterized protein (UPF0216 family)